MTKNSTDRFTFPRAEMTKHRLWYLSIWAGFTDMEIYRLTAWDPEKIRGAVTDWSLDWHNSEAYKAAQERLEKEGLEQAADLGVSSGDAGLARVRLQRRIQRTVEEGAIGWEEIDAFPGPYHSEDPANAVDSPKGNAHTYLDIVVTLRGIMPRIFREFLLPLSGTFQDLHQAIQDAATWEDSHLFAFSRSSDFKDQIAVSPHNEDTEVSRADQVLLSAYFSETSMETFTYFYDFGDTWEHDLVIRDVLRSPEVFERRLLAGSRAFPPEDCGGVDGYRRMLKFVRTGVDEQENNPSELRKWLGDWNSERFDLENVRQTFDR
jgi:hypothetical protein